MPNDAQQTMLKYLSNAHAMEEQSIAVLNKGIDIAGDPQIASIYNAHLMQSREHERYIRERLMALGEGPSKVKDAVLKASAGAIGLVAKAMPNTPLTLAVTAYAYENLEVASYRLLRGLAERAGDTETVAAVERILEQEEAAVELVAGTFDRVLDITLGQPPTSPLIPVTPLGRPSDRPEPGNQLPPQPSAEQYGRQSGTGYPGTGGVGTPGQ